VKSLRQKAHFTKRITVTGVSKICEMADSEVKKGSAGSLIEIYMTGRKELIKRMQKDGWDTSQTLEQQRKWIDKERRNRTKKIGIMLTHQLAGLIEQVTVSTRKWKEDKERIRELESQVRELEKRNQVLEDQGGGETDPLPSYEATQQEPTAPSEEWEQVEHNLAPITRGGTAARPKANYKPFTPGERQQIMASLGKLQTRSANTTFWEELDTIWVGHQLHLRDIHQLVRAACPVDKWRQVAGGGRWTHVIPLTAEIDAQLAPFLQFKEEIQRVLGNAPTNWSKITTTRQLKGEGASEYGERLFRIYQECSGQGNPGRGDRAFIQAFKDGLSNAHQIILKMGVIMSRDYDELVEWASGVPGEEKPQAQTRLGRVAAYNNGNGTKLKLICHNCGRQGHVARNCGTNKARNRDKHCSHCNKRGHTETVCWHKHGKPHARSTSPAEPQEPKHTQGQQD